MVTQCSSYIVKMYPTPLRTVTGCWDWEEDASGRKVVILKISDSVTKKSAKGCFTPEDIQNPDRVYHRFHELLGELLRPA